MLGYLFTLTRDVISRGLALGFDQDGHIIRILAVPSLEGLKKLQTVRLRRDGDVDRRTVFWGRLVSVVTWVEALRRERFTSRYRKLEVIAILVLQSVGKRVEVERASDCHGDNEIW